MRRKSRIGFRLSVVGSVAAAAAALSVPALAASPGPHPGPAGLVPAIRHASVKAASSDGESGQILSSAEQFAAVRTAPATTVSARAFTAAASAAARMHPAGGRWQQVTNQPYNSDAAHYRDPVWSNSGAGMGLVAGRMTALAAEGRAIYAGAAGGGVWKSTDAGRHWRPVFGRAGLSIGALAVNRADHSVWVGTGEANTNADAFSGDGVFRSANGGRTWRRVGNALPDSLIYRLTFDGHGHVYAATSRGLLRRSARNLTRHWHTVLKPDPNPGNSPYRTSFITDVRVKPRTHGKTVIAALGWRGGTLPTDLQYNGFYQSTDGGRTFSKLTLTGDLAGAADIGRTTFAYSRDGSVLYALIESSQPIGFKGVYKSASGNAAGPWTLIADSTTLGNANSAFALSGGTVGVQSWYNQALAVDPANPSHLYVDLEEVFETTDGGSTWSTIGPYWNFPYSCWNVDPAKDTCPNTSHPDQHALLIRGGQVYTANDGGVYAHPMRATGQVKWRDLNRTLHTLQFYYAGIGRAPHHKGDMIWGGMQDNGTGLLLPGARAMVSPFGGDGGDVIVDPRNGNRAVNEYVYLSMASTTNGGRSDGSTLAYSTISPSCFNPIFTPSPCDPNPRFIAPYTADPRNISHWVAGGEFVWDNQGKGWHTSCSPSACDWVQVHDTGAGNSINALADVGKVVYAGWCGNGCNPGGSAPFTSGIDTNFGGTWHTVSSPVLPNRIPTSFTVSPRQPAHVVVTYGGFSRHWIPSAGVGHVFASLNGGSTWADISGNLPDVPVNASTVWHGKLVVGTDVGAFAMSLSHPGHWQRLGLGLPRTQVVDLDVSPGQGYLLAATHGRGLWKITH